jgi:hypothetical protein
MAWLEVDDIQRGIDAFMGNGPRFFVIDRATTGQ